MNSYHNYNLLQLHKSRKRMKSKTRREKKENNLNNVIELTIIAITRENLKTEPKL
jgi:hypothetical protein